MKHGVIDVLTTHGVLEKVPKQDEPNLPELIPQMKVSDIEARSLCLRWLNEPREYKTRYARCNFQITKAELENLIFEVVYEGELPYCKVTNLKPETNYQFVLRFSPQEYDEYEWSEERSTIDVRTSDELMVNKAVVKLMRAIEEKNTKVVADILREYAGQMSIESTDKDGKTLLMMACQYGTPDMVQLLLNNGANYTATTLAGKSPISIAVTSGNLKIVETLLAKDPTLINYRDLSGTSLLLWAAESANVAEKKGHGHKMLSLLLSAGSDIQEENHHGHNALDRICITNGNVNYANFLIDNGIRVITEVDKKHQMTCLMTAALNGHTELCRLLLTRTKSDPRVKTENGGTALTMAETGNHPATAMVIKHRIAEYEK